MSISDSHNVAAKGRYIAIVSTAVETNNPQREIQPGLALLGPIIEAYVLSALFTLFLLIHCLFYAFVACFLVIACTSRVTDGGSVRTLAQHVIHDLFYSSVLHICGICSPLFCC